MNERHTDLWISSKLTLKDMKDLSCAVRSKRPLQISRSYLSNAAIQGMHVSLTLPIKDTGSSTQTNLAWNAILTHLTISAFLNGLHL